MRTLSLVLTLFLSPCLFAQSTLITSINGYTLNSNRELQRFTALQIEDGRVVQIFTQDEPLPQGEDIQRLDGGGKTVIPGLIDAHGHILNYGLSLLRVDLTGTRSEQEAVQRVADFATRNPDIEWVQGRGWNQVLWDSNAFPEAASLDAAIGDRPIWLSRVDGHAGWANGAALRIAGIDLQTPDPDGGQIIRDAEGRPTGVLVDNAMRLVSSKIPPLSVDEQKFALRNAMTALAAEGLTSVHDAGISATTVAAYQALVEEGPLPIRVNAMLSATDTDIEGLLAAGRYQSSDSTLAIHSIKIVADGALGSRGAALIEDYSDMPGHRGLLIHSNDRLLSLMLSAMEAGFQVNTHAIGDDANRIVLEGYAALIPVTGTRNLRHRVEHAQVLQFEDIQKFSALGVIPSMQATHATSDKNMAEDRLGPVRIQGAYAWRKLLETGVIIANGSDFPVESPNPFFGLHAAVTRQDHENNPPGGWYAEEAMTLVEALASFTLDAAYAGHQEELLGTLEPGKLADFIMLDRDIFSISQEDIWRTQVEQTWVGGQRIH